MHWRLEQMRLFSTDLIGAWPLPTFGRTSFRSFEFHPYDSIDRTGFLRLYESLRGVALPLWRRHLFSLVGDRLLLLVAKETRLIGFCLFTFRQHEVRDRIIHLAYIGLDKSYRGEGLGSEIWRLTASHFAKAGSRAITTCIKANNIASLRSAQKAGYRFTEPMQPEPNASPTRELRLDLSPSIPEQS